MDNIISLKYRITTDSTQLETLLSATELSAHDLGVQATLLGIVEALQSECVVTIELGPKILIRILEVMFNVQGCLYTW